MTNYLLIFDTLSIDSHYKIITEEINKMGKWRMCIDNAFVLISNLSSHDIKNQLKHFGEPKLIVSEITKNTSYENLDKDSSQFLFAIT